MKSDPPKQVRPRVPQTRPVNSIKLNSSLFDPLVILWSETGT